MRRGFVLVIAVLGVGLVFSSGARAAEHKYIGATKCKMCHNTEAQGKQYEKWLASRPSKAYETLGSGAAKKRAADKGLGDPQKADACLKCHVTAHGVKPELLDTKYAAKEGVTCESCH